MHHVRVTLQDIADLLTGRKVELANSTQLSVDAIDIQLAVNYSEFSEDTFNQKLLEKIEELM